MTRMQKISILSISLITIMSSAAISPALSYIGDYFDDTSDLLVKMVVSLPAIFIIPVTLITGKLIFYVKKKYLLYIGLSLYIIGGVGGSFANSIYMLLILRAVLGIGVGLVLPLTRGVVADFFTGKERVKMMGYASSTNNLGGIIATSLGGVLAVYSWRYPFLIYLTAIVVLVLVIMYMPDHEVEEKPTTKTVINKNVWIIGFSHFVVIMIFYAIPADLSYFISRSNLGTGATTGLLISIVTITSFFTGLSFHRISEKLKDYTVLTGLSSLTLGMFGVSIANSVVGVAIPLIFVGIGLGVLAPNIYLSASVESDKKDVTLSLAIVSCFSFLGQFSSPIVNSFIQDIFKFYTIESTYVISTGVGIVAIILVVLNKFIKVYIPNNK